MDKELVSRMNRILGSFKINAECVYAHRHRHLAFFDVALAPGTRIRKIELFAREIGLALNVMDNTGPIITTSPKEGVVKIKVVFDKAPMLKYETLIKTEPLKKAILPLAFGETDVGDPLWVDMARMPHMLVAGSTGSGKSTFLHVLIANVLNKGDVDLYLVDPKRGVEFGCYKDRAAYLAIDYITTLSMLRMLRQQMDATYQALERAGINSIEKMPSMFNKTLVVIDEVADLMAIDNNKKNPYRRQFEETLCNLAAKGRAAGIYIVLATQRPSVDVITGLIKSNFPARLSCKVSSAIDSKVILDQPGAEMLLNNGDAILKSPVHDFVRFQVAFIDPAKKAA